ncbi:MAG: hypothetical protein V2A54_01150 [Bacteroidota bacterium]
MKTKVSSQQLVFLEQIKSRIPASSSLVAELSSILNITTDRAYRRIRGETVLNMDEIIALCSRFHLSFDSVMSQYSGNISFRYSRMSSTEEEFRAYLEEMLAGLIQLRKAENAKVTYTAEDIPIFYHFGYPAIAAFKIFYWLKSVSGYNEFEKHKFKCDIISPELIELCRKIYNEYLHIPSLEIWSEGSMNSLIKQIEYYAGSGQFASREEALQVFDEISTEINDIELMAQMGNKLIKLNIQDATENLEMYFSEIEIGNNVILAKTTGTSHVYIRHYTFNSMFTSHPVFIDDTESWIKNLLVKSVPISRLSEKHRYQYFKMIRLQLDVLKKIIDEI